MRPSSTPMAACCTFDADGPLRLTREELRAWYKVTWLRKLWMFHLAIVVLLCGSFALGQVGGSTLSGLQLGVAASVLTAAHQRGNLVRLVFADGTDSGFMAGNAQLEALLELLAIVALRPEATLRGAVDHAGTNARRGAVVIITAELDPTGHVLVQRLQRTFGSVCSVVVDRSAYDPAAPEAAPAASRRFVRITRSATFPEVWLRAMRVQYADVSARAPS